MNDSIKKFRTIPAVNELDLRDAVPHGATSSKSNQYISVLSVCIYPGLLFGNDQFERKPCYLDWRFQH